MMGSKIGNKKGGGCSCAGYEEMWEMEVWLHSFLISALDGDEWSASRPGPRCSHRRRPENLSGLLQQERKTYQPEGNRIIVSKRSTNEVMRCELWS